jgi:hypothetical protein
VSDRDLVSFVRWCFALLLACFVLIVGVATTLGVFALVRTLVTHVL